MTTVTETFPATLPTISEKTDVATVPSGEDAYWVDAGDMNSLGQTLAVMRAMRLHALLPAMAPATAGVNGRAVRFTGQNANGLPNTSTTLTTDLNKVFAAAIEKIEGGGDLDGTASNTGFFGVPVGLITHAGTTNDLYQLDANGYLTAYLGGTRAPVAIQLSTSCAMVDLGGRFLAKSSHLSFYADGSLGLAGTPSFAGQVNMAGPLCLGTVTMEGTGSNLQINAGKGLYLLSGGVLLQNGGYDFVGANDYKAAGSTVIDASRNIYGASMNASSWVNTASGYKVGGSALADVSRNVYGVSMNASSYVNTASGYKVGGTAAIDVSRNFYGASIHASSNLAVDGTATFAGVVNMLSNCTVSGTVTAVGNIVGKSSVYTSTIYVGTIGSYRAKINENGCMCIKLLNRTGSASVKGLLVRASTSFADAVATLPSASPHWVGCFESAGVANATYAWICTEGRAQVLLENNTSASPGNWLRPATATAGRAYGELADPPGAGVPELDIHMKEVGHVIDDQTSGTNVLCWALLHKN